MSRSVYDWSGYDQRRHVCREGYLVEVILAVLRAADDPEQPGESQRLADVTQIAIGALLEMGYQSEPPRRLPSCVERWPECESGAYDPRCCRFPKSCSCTSHDDIP